MRDLSYLEDPAEILTALKEIEATETKPDHLPDKLPITGIRRLPNLFQPRGLEEDERHISELVRALTGREALDPVLLIQVGADAYLMDGHHRCAAYEQAGVVVAVPVQYFNGSLEEAVLEAGRANSKAKLPMTPQQRQDYAWRLVLMGTFSKAQEMEASSVGEGSVARMRRAKKELGESASDYPTWAKARRAWQGAQDELSPEDREAWKEEEAQRLADRMSKHLGANKLARNPEITARALEICLGRKTKEVVRELADYLEDDDEEDDEADF